MRNQVNRVLLVVMFFSASLSACTKTNDVPAMINAQEVKDVALINKYLQSSNITAKQVDSAGLSTGVYYTVDTLGAANTLFTNSTTVTVSFTSWLLTANGTLGSVITQSDQSGKPNQFHPSFVLGTVIRGWQLAIPKIGTGGAITFYLPSRYAYGPFPQPTLGLPANAVLIFHIVLYNVTN